MVPWGGTIEVMDSMLIVGLPPLSFVQDITNISKKDTRKYLLFMGLF
jgi:hypothetical protein